MNDGIILLAKPAGLTSFQALGALKRSLDTGRIGHAGTLDRFAEGLLIALSGKLTRLCPYASGLSKEYVARVTFGKETDTLDPEGRVTAEGPIPTLEAVKGSLGGFLGEILQVPPQYSAIHIGGRRAYQAARSGESPVLKPRPVTIHSLELLEFDDTDALLRISCSSGTYIRSLARDIAAALGTYAFVSGLSRVRIGDFRIEEAVSPGEFDPKKHMLPPSVFFDRCPRLGRLTAIDGWEKKISLGVVPRDSSFQTPPVNEGFYGVFSGDGRLLALVEKRQEGLRYAAVLTESGS